MLTLHEPGVSRTQIALPFTGEGADIARKGLCSPVTSTVCLKLRVSTAVRLKGVSGCQQGCSGSKENNDPR